jgi:hypothetical protein
LIYDFYGVVGTVFNFLLSEPDVYTI